MREIRLHRNIYIHSTLAFFFLYWMSDFSVTLKGLISRDEYFLKAYNNKLVLSVHALAVFTFFCLLVDEKIKLKVVACFFEITLFCKITPDTACDKLILAHFPCS
jgi:hypothetical protein